VFRDLRGLDAHDFLGFFCVKMVLILCEKIYFFYDLNLSLFCHFFVSLYVFTGTGLGVVF